MIKDLEYKGYCVIKNFLGNDILEKLQNEYLTSNSSDKNKNYTLTLSKFPLNEIVSPIVKLIRQDTDILVDITANSGVFFDNSQINFNWHQDHEPYYMFQDSYNALNFWIPIIKESPNKSGISIIPHDQLKIKCPHLFDSEIKGKGAKSIKNVEGKSIIVDDNIGKNIDLTFDITLLAISPELNPGDLLILRQDIFHKTQDIETKRVAISIRAYNSNTILKKDVLLSGGNVKKRMIKDNPEPYESILNYFNEHSLNECYLRDVF